MNHRPPFVLALIAALCACAVGQSNSSLQEKLRIVKLEAERAANSGDPEVGMSCRERIEETLETVVIPESSDFSPRDLADRAALHYLTAQMYLLPGHNTKREDEVEAARMNLITSLNLLRELKAQTEGEAARVVLEKELIVRGRLQDLGRGTDGIPGTAEASFEDAVDNGLVRGTSFLGYADPWDWLKDRAPAEGDLRASLTLGLGYDSNANAAPRSKVRIPQFGDEFPLEVERVDAMAHTVRADLIGGIGFRGYGAPRLDGMVEYYRAGFSEYNDWSPDEFDYDFDETSFYGEHSRDVPDSVLDAPVIKDLLDVLGVDNMRAAVGAGGSYSWFDGDRYARSHGATLRFSTRHEHRVLNTSEGGGHNNRDSIAGGFDLSFRLGEGKYYEQDRFLDSVEVGQRVNDPIPKRRSEEQSVTARYIHELGGRGGFSLEVRAFLGDTDFDPISISGGEPTDLYSHQQYGGSGTLLFETRSYDVAGTVTVRQSDFYEDRVPFFEDRQREDTQLSLDLNIAWKLGDITPESDFNRNRLVRIRPGIAFSWTRNDSEISLYDYRRFQVMPLLRIDFH